MNNQHKVFFTIAIALFISSCKQRLDYEAFSTQLSTSFATADTTIKKSSVSKANMAYLLYRNNGFNPLWITEEGKTPDGEKLTEQLKELGAEGLSLSRYHIEELEEQLKALKKDKGNIETGKAIALDRQLTEAYTTAAHDLLYGITDPDDVTDMWYHKNDTFYAKLYSKADNQFPALDAFRSRLRIYKALVSARKNATDDSTRRKMDVNLERLRWLPQDFEDEYVLVVVPTMQMRYMQDNDVKMKMNAIIGKPDRETPTLTANMVNIVFNPSWGVPPGIMKKDVIPGLLNKGTAYLDKKGLKIYDHDGNEVSPSVINESNYKSYVFRQPPSEKNALGQLKFNMPNAWDIYLHDTPSKGDFEKEDRALSSGCVRLQQPLQLAEFLLKHINGGANDTLNIDSLIATDKTQYVPLKKKLPVHIVYLTAYSDSGEPELLRDVYEKDAAVYASLTAVK